MKKTLAELPDVLTVLEVAHILRINKDAAYTLVRVGTLGHFKCGRSIRVPKLEVLKLLGHSAQVPTKFSAGST